jgi:hypothetical protein
MSLESSANFPVTFEAYLKDERFSPLSNSKKVQEKRRKAREEKRREEKEENGREEQEKRRETRDGEKREIGLCLISFLRCLLFFFQ